MTDLEEKKRRQKESAARSRAKHREKRLEDTRRWRAKNREHVKEYNQKYVADNKERYAALNVKWREENREHRNTQLRDRYHTDPRYKWRVRLSNGLHQVVQRRGTDKAFATLELIGCTVDELLSHLETRFTEGMNWDNYGSYKNGKAMTWHIDHIRPCASFDLTDPVQQKACFHYSNLQPLWAVDNCSKSDTYSGDDSHIMWDEIFSDSEEV